MAFPFVTQEWNGHWLTIRLWLVQLDAHHGLWYTPNVMVRWPPRCSSCLYPAALTLVSVIGLLGYCSAVAVAASRLHWNVESVLTKSMWALGATSVAIAFTRHALGVRADLDTVTQQLAQQLIAQAEAEHNADAR